MEVSERKVGQFLSAPKWQIWEGGMCDREPTAVSLTGVDIVRGKKIAIPMGKK